MLFTNRNKIPQFKAQSLDFKILKISSTAKYLGVVLDFKLNWKNNIEYRRQKTYIAFYICKRLFSRNWRLKPKLVMWMYTAIMRPILTYCQNQASQQAAPESYRATCLLDTFDRLFKKMVAFRLTPFTEEEKRVIPVPTRFPLVFGLLESGAVKNRS